VFDRCSLRRCELHEQEEIIMTGSKCSFVWYELLTSDVPAAKAFYGKVVGWDYQDVPMPGMTYTLLHAGKTQVGGLMAVPEEARTAGMRPNWAGYVAVHDVDAAAADLTRAGGIVHRPPADIPDVGRFAVVADPQGAVFNLFKGSQPGEHTATMSPGHIGWHELHSSDWPRAFDFYHGLFGWLKGEAVDMGPMGTYQLFTIGGVPAGGMFNSPAAATARFWLYYFIVDAIDAAAKRVVDAGGKVMHGPQPVPGGSWIVQASDPQGAAFALVGPRR
jgi:predicted enzyme related to lactoylglutathione lyase